MSAILSADDLNDFISPGVACIKPVETVPIQRPDTDFNPYEVTTEDKVNAAKPPPAQISLTDCLACSGCVTSAEAVLVSLQSHGEVLDTLDRYNELPIPTNDLRPEADHLGDAKIFVASVSPQTRASIAATYNVTEKEAGNMIQQLLSGPHGVRSGGRNGSGFSWVLDTNAMREVALVAAADEALQALGTSSDGPKLPILTSACPGWICYAEKTHPHILPHLSKLKSPQALTGTLVKSVLSRRYGISPERIWHLAIMPCFDKKLEASRAELTSRTWHSQDMEAVRDVDCVITARELLMLAESRTISFPCLPRTPVSKQFAPPFPDAAVDRFLFRRKELKRKRDNTDSEIGTSGGYLYHILKTQQADAPGSTIRVQRGRNADVSEYSIISATGQEIFRAARYYGFRNIQNLVRRLKPAKVSRMPGAIRKSGSVRRPGGGDTGSGERSYAYVEVMACPGGCTNGGGQIKVGDVATLRQTGGTGVENGSPQQEVLPAQREWLAKVDEAYWSTESDDLIQGDGERDVNMKDGDIVHANGNISSKVINGMNTQAARDLLARWVDITGIDQKKLICTTYRVVESNVGKARSEGSDMEKVSALAVAAGGGW